MTSGLNLRLLGTRKQAEHCSISRHVLNKYPFMSPCRTNLDPWDQYSDSEIWEALEKTHIKEMVSDRTIRLCREYSWNVISC